MGTRIEILTVHAAMLALFVLAGRSWAGEITGIKVVPELQYTGIPVYVTVEGDGSCDAGVGVLYGDGDVVWQKGHFPRKFEPHTFHKSGTYKIFAASNKQDTSCNFNPVYTTLEVFSTPGAMVEALCEATNCDEEEKAVATGLAEDLCESVGCRESTLAKLEVAAASTKAAFTPRIDSVFFTPVPGGGMPGELAVLTPGGRIYLKGENFGSSPGTVLLNGNFKGAGSLALEDLNWDASGTKVDGKIPTGASASLRIDVSLQVLTKVNAPSNTYARQFEVPGEIRLLLTAENSLDAVVSSFCGESDGISCNNRDDYSYCDFTGLSDQPPQLDDFGLSKHNVRPPTFMALHSNCAIDIDDEKGKDTHTIKLSNGCVIYDVETRTFKSSGKEYVGHALIDDFGTPELQASIDWIVTPADLVAYWYWVWIKCPK